MTDIVIAGAARTPVGSFNGALSGVSASYLGTVAIKESLKRAGVAPEEVDEVIMGQILDEGEDPEDATEAWLKAHPEVLDAWLDGVTTKDGGDAMAAVKDALGL